MQKKMTKFKNIFIGEIDGESEANRSDFQELFVNKDDEYKKLLTGDKFIIKGRKGTGKTYLSQYVAIKASNEKNSFCRICDSSKFNLQRLIDLNGREFLKGECEIFWEWIILMHFAEVILTNNKYASKIPFTKKKKLSKFINKRYPNPEAVFENMSYSDTLSSKFGGKLLKKDKSEAYGEGSKSRNSSFQRKEYYKNLEYLNSLIVDILSKDINVTLIYDDLDSIEANALLDSFYIDLLGGLLKCVKKINLQIKNKYRSKELKSKVIVVLRDDILCYMQDFNTNLNKVSSHFVDLYWLDKGKTNEPSQHPLMNLILYKIKKSVPEYSALSNKKLYETLFPKKIKGKEPIYHLLDHSFGRPRDIIKYLNIILENNSSATTFKPKYFKDCMKEYSNWFYDELRNEIAIHHNAEFLRESLELVKNIRKINFKKEDVELTYNENKTSYPNISDYKEAIVSMYKLGVVGNSWTTTDDNGNEKYRISWGYRKDADYEPDFGKNFVIHSALRKKFSLY